MLFCSKKWKKSVQNSYRHRKLSTSTHFMRPFRQQEPLANRCFLCLTLFLHLLSKSSVYMGLKIKFSASCLCGQKTLFSSVICGHLNLESSAACGHCLNPGLSSVNCSYSFLSPLLQSVSEYMDNQSPTGAQFSISVQ